MAYQVIGRILGPAIFLLMLAVADSQSAMSLQAWYAAAVGIWMAIWWATEAIPVAVTAFLPLVLFEPLGVLTLKDAASRYADPVIFLYLGGFIMALAVERWNLHRRIALAILERTGTDGRRLVGGFMFVCAMLSMWMSNTSTTMMLLPIVLSVIAVIRDNVPNISDRAQADFRIAMLLGLAYAASIGGLATLVGTPPNALLVAHMAENHGIEISFARWMLVGVPVTALLLPAAWLLLTRILYPVHIPANAAVDSHLHDLREAMGPMTVAERRVAVIFGTVIFCWMFRGLLTGWLGISGVSDPGIVIAAAVVLFLMPSADATQPQLMTWPDVLRLPWGVLILFGGGLSLAAAVSESGLALWLGGSLAPLTVLGSVVLIVAAVALVVFLTELTSNLATTATLLPVIGAIAVQAGMPPLLLTVPITIAASCAFMLPVATPPNAIVFSTGDVSIPQMVKAGFWLNLFCIVMISLIAMFLVPNVF
ncbi:MAG: DASS family sodium-coupled anion symporter [Gammaproteobacteria bacterium]|nr:DASS family sodium-coupled anion symporter [Gammaproteobacteria bacterium]MDH5304216.1 DASS family sodium-coupled anion symporter [Gammaproteobacteria bacterium]MDH5322169.1 DASS family sodium-coupled anion symporter [Gammaproteobacteria bacterium]